MGAALHRGNSTQAVRTPQEFLVAVQRRFGNLTFDLAATPSNAVAAKFYTKRQNALRASLRWPVRGINWLNPPFDTIGPWVAKAYSESSLFGARTLVLLPCSPGTAWYRDFVEFKCAVFPIGNPRLVFVGHEHGFPKDLMLLAYGFGLVGWQPQWAWAQEAA